MFDFADLSDAENGDEGLGESPEEVQQHRKPDASIRFCPGDVVKARFQQGCWYLASIVRENSDGTYTISWNDGDHHDRVKERGELIYIRPGDSKLREPRQPVPTNPQDTSPEPQWRHSQAGADARESEETRSRGDSQRDSGYSGYQSVPEDRESQKWNEWDAQQRRFRKELEQREEREDQKWLEGRMAKLQMELREIDKLAPGVKKARLRKLQLELHPDKQPERIRAKAQELFLLVQGRWEANEATFQREAQVKTKHEEERAQQAAWEAREERRRRQEERERQERQERQREETERILREEKERQEKEAEEKRRHNAESRAKQAEQELKRFKEAAARQRSKQNEKSESASHGKTQSKSAESSTTSFASKSQYDPSAPQADSPFLSHGQAGHQKENAPPNKEVGSSIHVRLRINGINSNRPTFSVKSTATVGSIRESLQSSSGIPIPLQKLFIGERELFDFETLKQLLKSGNTLDLDIAEVPQKGSALADRIRRNWRMLQHAPEEMKSDKHLVLEAVKQSWEALQFAADRLKRDREIAFAALEQDGLALEHVSSTLHSDREIMLAAVQRTWRALRYATFEIASDVEIAFLAVQQDWRALQYLSSENRDNKELLETAVQQSGLALRYASKRLQKDHDTVLAAVRQNGNAFSHAAAELRADRQFVLAAVWKNGAALRYVDPDLRADREVALAAVSGWDWHHSSATVLGSEHLHQLRSLGHLSSPKSKS